MTITSQELYHSRSIRVDGGVLIGKRTFKVFDSDGGQITMAEGKGAPGLPRIGSLHPEDTRLRMIGFENEHEVGIGIYHVTAVYEGIIQGIAAARLDSGDQFSRLEEEWRRASSVDPDNGTEQWGLGPPALTIPDRQDIGGVPIDVWGNPVSVTRTRAIYEYTIFWDRYNALPTPQWGALYGKRNNAPYFGNAAGSLLYTGSRYRPYRPTIIAVTHRLVWDDRFHNVQVPVRDQINWPKLTPFAGGPEDVHAETVYWHQPFPFTGPFDILQIPAGTIPDPALPDEP